MSFSRKLLFTQVEISLTQDITSFDRVPSCVNTSHNPLCYSKNSSANLKKLSISGEEQGGVVR
jgi:hypothetical protein